MFVLKIKEMLEQRGYKPSYTQLSKMGIPRNAAKMYLYNTAKSIKMEHLYRLCVQLNCTPMELMQVRVPEKFEWKEEMPLYSWREQVVLNPLHEIKKLSPEKLKKLDNYLKEEILGK